VVSTRGQIDMPAVVKGIEGACARVEEID
jgi:hypothetical protein